MSLDVETPVLRPNFARHETFHPRYGWLRKAYDAAKASASEFLREDATTRLGVGKNMVRAIRYWGLAYKILDERVSSENSRLLGVVITPFGLRLLDEETGWDPYLEEPGSLWLLHWQLLRPECRAPAWWAIFNSPRVGEFTDEALIAELRRFCDEQPDAFRDVAESSLDKDARCLLRMYGSVTQGRDLPEDSVDSPFAELDLLRPVPGSRRQWQINRGPKRGLPDAIIAWACLDYAIFTGVESRTLSVASLTRSAGSPGRGFALTETALADALARFSEHSPELRLTSGAGMRQVVLPDDLPAAAAKILDDFYGHRRKARTR